MALKAYQAKLEYGDTADHATATSWTAVATVKTIKPPKVQAKEIDTTTLDSADEFEESIAGLGNGGELEASIQYAKVLTGTLYGFFRTVKAWRVRYSDDSGWKFNAFINEFGDEEVVNGEILMTGLKMKVTGKPAHSADLTP